MLEIDSLDEKSPFKIEQTFAIITHIQWRRQFLALKEGDVVLENKDPHRYDYMIYMQPSEPLYRRTMHHRAAQFMGFRAVAGHEDMIREEGRVTEEKLELDELESDL